MGLGFTGLRSESTPHASIRFLRNSLSLSTTTSPAPFLNPQPPTPFLPPFLKHIYDGDSFLARSGGSEGKGRRRALMRRS